MTDGSGDYSHLDEDETDDGLDDLEFSARNMAIVVALPDLDYDSQLTAIRNLLEHYRKAEDHYNDQIREAARLARDPGPTRHPFEESFREQAWIDQMHYSTYHCAAHSMSIVAFIAPLLETIFFQYFREIERHVTKSPSPIEHERWQLPAEYQWDCRHVWKNGRRNRSLVEGIVQLVDALDMTDYMPDDLRVTLSALFAYRNKMLHGGFEWPLEERQRFVRRLSGSDWPEDWFSMATSGGEPWMFYMTPTFVTHCLDRIERIIEGIGQFYKERFDDGLR